MTFVFYAIAATAIAGGLVSVTAVSFAHIRRILERKRAFWVSTHALRFLLTRLDSDAHSNVDIADLGWQITHTFGIRAFDSQLSDLKAAAENHPQRHDLYYEFFYRNFPVEPRSRVDKPPQSGRLRRLRRPFGEKKISRRSVAEIPVEVYAQSELVRANVFGGLYLLSDKADLSERTRWR